MALLPHFLLFAPRVPIDPYPLGFGGDQHGLAFESAAIRYGHTRQGGGVCRVSERGLDTRIGGLNDKPAGPAPVL